jgi:hypothetical protein
LFLQNGTLIASGTGHQELMPCQAIEKAKKFRI